VCLLAFLATGTNQTPIHLNSIDNKTFMILVVQWQYVRGWMDGWMDGDLKLALRLLQWTKPNPINQKQVAQENSDNKWNLQIA